jgi:uncharacterized protein (TIGR00251 family)
MASTAPECVRIAPNGVLLSLRVQPKAARDCLRGVRNGALKLAVRAAPEKGKANQAVVEFLASTLGIAKSRIQVVSGATSQDKQVLVAAQPAECSGLAAQLRAIIEAQSS